MSANKVSYAFIILNRTSNWHLCYSLERWSENSILRERPADCRTSSAALWLEKPGSWLPRCQRWNFRHGKPLQNALWRQGPWWAWEPRATEQNLRRDLWRTQTARRPQVPPLWQVSNNFSGYSNSNISVTLSVWCKLVFNLVIFRFSSQLQFDCWFVSL